MAETLVHDPSECLETWWDNPELHQDIWKEALEAVAQKSINISNPALLDLARQEYHELQAAMQNHEELSDESSVPRQEFLDDIKALERLQGSFWDVSVPGGDTTGGLQNMISFISTLDGESQEALLSSLSDNRVRKLKKYFEANGFINAETYEVFAQSEYGEWLSTSVTLESTIHNSDIWIINQKESWFEQRITYLSSQVDIILNISRQSPSTIDTELQQIFWRFQEYGEISESNFEAVEWDYQAITDYFANLAQEPEQFAVVMDSLGWQESPLYEQVKTFVLSTGNAPWLAVAFQNYETPETVSPMVVSQQESATDVVEEINNDTQWADIAEVYDYTTVPPTRSLTLEWDSDRTYQLESNLPVGDNYPATVEYTDAIQWIEPKLNTISDVLGYLENLWGSEDFWQVVKQLDSMMWYSLKQDLGCMNLNKYSSVSQLKSELSGMLWRKKSELEEKRREAREKYEQALLEVQESYKATIREQQEQQRQILLFLRQTWFDLIPQSFTDRIIREINIRKNIDLGNGFSINDDINIANGDFWYNAVWDGDKEKEGFVRLINKMLTGKTDGPDTIVPDPASFVVRKQIVQDTQMIHALNNWPSAIISNTGGLKISQVEKNLWWN